ncbi:SDR family NAD(P)-dependent oxidoreductase [Kitasatospora sp. NPDC057015]|uniref:SDR family NAD(P)-dependent oxidoreductase n=1 Tax=Kitasatospora sp. NPDC057015 TaxID=3346001 RepID=UPI00363B7598
MTRTALITGVAGGIGRAVAARFVADGFRVAGLDATDPGVDGVTPYLADATDGGEVDVAVHRVIADHGGVDVLVTCSGLTTGRPLHCATEEEWNAVITANLTSVFLCVREVLPVMIGARSGAVVTIGSVLHRTAAPGLPAYAAAKGAVAALCRQLAVDYGRFGISFVTVSPGWIRTPATEARLAGGVTDLHRLRDSNPMRLLARPEDVADVVAFAASPAAAVISGSELVLDAGASVVNPASLLRDAHREQLGLPPLDRS